MGKPKADFTLDDLLAQLQPDEIIDGLTIRELCEQAGLPLTDNNMNKVRRKVNNLKALGFWEYAGQRELPNVSGHPRKRAAFRPKERR